MSVHPHFQSKSMPTEISSFNANPPSQTVAGIVSDPHWSGRTFNIPDCPASQTAGTLKEWYTRNICPTAQLSQISIVNQNGAVVDDKCPFWQLTEAEGMFQVSVVHMMTPSQPGPARVKPMPAGGSITLYVEHDITGMSTPIQLPVHSTLLQLKIAAFEQLGLGDAVSAAGPNVGITFKGATIDNESTIAAANLNHGDHVYVGERRLATPQDSPALAGVKEPALRPSNGNASAAGGFGSIASIWASTEAPQDAMQSITSGLDRLMDDEPRRPRSRNQEGKQKPARRKPNDIERMKASYRTKMCRAGLADCKYGHSCWFAHTPEELRKPSDPLPASCPGVNKLEKYARRQDGSSIYKDQ